MKNAPEVPRKCTKKSPKFKKKEKKKQKKKEKRLSFYYYCVKQ